MLLKGPVLRPVSDDAHAMADDSVSNFESGSGVIADSDYFPSYVLAENGGVGHRDEGCVLQGFVNGGDGHCVDADEEFVGGGEIPFWGGEDLEGRVG